MKTKLPWILLVLVTAFGASYLIGSHRASTHESRLSEEDQVRIIAQQLNLDAPQKAAYIAFRKDMAEKETQRIQSQIDRLKAMRDRIVQPDTAPRNGAAIIEDTAQAQREFMKFSANRMRQFMAELRPEQREKFFDLLIQTQTERISRVNQSAP